MRRVIFIMIFIGANLCGSSYCLSQSSRILNIWLGDKQSLNENYVLYLNGRRITSLKPLELISYETYTVEPINIEIYSAKSGLLKYSNQFILDGSPEFYFQANTAGYPSKAYIEQLSKSAVDSIEKDFFITKRIFKEDYQNPIGRTSTAVKTPKQGTGFLISDAGYVLTCFHVVEDAQKIQISGINGEMNSYFEASLVASDRLLDIAILRIESSMLQFPAPSYAFAQSPDLRTGEKVIAFGYPIADALGSELKVTDGIVNSTTGFKNSISTFQFSAPVQPGNSGGPLINSKGKVVGLISSKISSSSVESVSYALKADYIKFFLNQVRTISVDGPIDVIQTGNMEDLVDEVRNTVYLVKTE